MRQKCILKTSGFELVFYLQSLDSSKDCLGIITEFILNPSHGEISIRSIATYIYMKDLEKLIQYLEWHIAAMKNDLGYQSQVFISYGNCFQLQALQGQLRSENEGEFTIRCMVNIDKPAGEIFSTYVGGEGVISIENTQLFISSLRMKLNSFLQCDHPSL